MSHLHVYYGAARHQRFSTSDSLGAAGTTCAMPGDTSVYWLPAVFAQGKQLAPGTTRHALFYYRRIAAPAGTRVATIPDGLRFVVGRAHAQSPSDNPLLGSRIAWRCGTGSGMSGCGAGPWQAPISVRPRAPASPVKDSFRVTWASDAPAAWRFGVQFRIGQGIWRSWKPGTALELAVFNGRNGKVYFFRARTTKDCKATDWSPSRRVVT